MKHLIFLAIFCAFTNVNAQYQRIIKNYNNSSIDQNLASITTKGSANATTPQITEDDGIKYVTFDFNVGPGAKDAYDQNRPIASFNPEYILEAENYSSHGSTDIYLHEAASGGKAIASFGDRGVDYFGFENVPPAHQLIIYYTNGSGKTNTCGLYVNDKRIATLEFTPTDSWQSGYQPLIYNGYLHGNLKLQVDQEDHPKNVSFCCIVDRLVLKDVISRKGEIIQTLPLKKGALQKDDHAVSFLVKAPNVPFYVVLQDQNGHEYASMKFRQSTISYVNPRSWERFTVLLNDFKPAITGDIAASIKSVHFVLSKENERVSGQFAVREILASKGWPSTVPAECPLEESEDYKGIYFTGRHAEYTGADTWYPSWAEDGNLYSPYTDGTVEGLFSRSDNPAATTGMAVIIGDSPMDLKVKTLGLYTSRANPLGTRYPCGTLLYNGVWYYGTYNIGFPGPPVGSAMGPFVGFRHSKDYGTTWTETKCTPLDNLFGVKVEPEGKGLLSPVKIGAPHFVDFGKNMQHSPDGKAYMVGHGTSVPDDYSAFTWTMGSEVNIARVKPSPENMDDVSEYEFFAGFDKKDKPQWTNDIEAMKPIIDWPRRTGCVTTTYNSVLEKYFMCVTTSQTNVNEAFDTYILESDRIEGPFRMIAYMEDFGRQAYFVNIPSKFISEDGLTMWLCYSANYSLQTGSPRHSAYTMDLREFKLMDK